MGDFVPRLVVFLTKKHTSLVYLQQKTPFMKRSVALTWLLVRKRQDFFVVYNGVGSRRKEDAGTIQVDGERSETGHSHVAVTWLAVDQHFESRRTAVSCEVVPAFSEKGVHFTIEGPVMGVARNGTGSYGEIKMCYP